MATTGLYIHGAKNGYQRTLSAQQSDGASWWDHVAVGVKRVGRIEKHDLDVSAYCLYNYVQDNRHRYSRVASTTYATLGLACYMTPA